MSRRRLLAGLGLLAALGTWWLAPGARLVDVAPLQGMVRSGEPARLEVLVERPWYDPRPVKLTFTHGFRTVATLITWGGIVAWTPPAAGGYGVTAELGRWRASTAIDSGENWVERPRYGFLSDFGPGDRGQEERFRTMARYHLNGLQFYDWMYRHSDYIPPTEEFVDPLGRLLSRTTVQEKMSLARRYGMAAMAYTAVYGAPREFYEAHREWALYDASGRAITFGDGFLYIMNPEPGGPWAEHMVSEYSKITGPFDFDGIHLDQYGDPRYGYRYPGGPDAQPVDVASAFAALIDATKRAIGPAKRVLFNDVGGWPLADTAPTSNDAIYIEVWPPNIHFQHLFELIDRGRKLSGGKPVVLAAYISPEFEPSVLLTDAVIFAAGGYHIELGEGGAMLADPYFPRYQAMSPGLAAHLRRYYDITVRYQDFLYSPDLAAWEPEVEVEGSRVLKGGYFNGVWPVGRESDRYAVLSLINLNGLTDATWNAPRKEPPPVLEKRAVSVELAGRPKALYLIDADGPDQSAVSVPFTYKDGRVNFILDRLAYWSLVVMEK